MSCSHLKSVNKISKIRKFRIVQVDRCVNKQVEFKKKVNDAIAVLYARQLLNTILASWPETEEMTSSFFSNFDPQDVVGLLDLLRESGTEDRSDIIIRKLIKCCSSEYIKPLALSATYAMNQVSPSVMRESKHKYETDEKCEDKVHIPGMNCMSFSLLVYFTEVL